jgi:hypothetical protein
MGTLVACETTRAIGGYSRRTSSLCRVSSPLCTATSDFKTKPNAHSMCAQESSFHTYRIENGYRITNDTIYNNYYTNNGFSKRLNQALSKHSSRKTP